jgi:hypothetical protein
VLTSSLSPLLLSLVCRLFRSECGRHVIREEYMHGRQRRSLRPMYGNPNPNPNPKEGRGLVCTLCSAHFSTEFCSSLAIEFHAFAPPLEASMRAFLSGVHSLTG